MSALQINFREEGEAIVIELSGTIDTSRAVENLYNLISRSSSTKFAVSMKGVDYINSAGFAEMIVLNQNAKKNGKRLVLCEMTPKVSAVFENLGGMRLLEIVETEAAAVGSLA